MNLEAAKLSVMQKIMSVESASLIEKIEGILDEEMIVAYTSSGEPLTVEKYKEHIDEVIAKAEAGEVISQEDMEATL